MINPVELLQLNYYELESISIEMIAEAESRLLAKASEGGITYKGAKLSREEVEAAVATLREEGRLEFFYALHKYPGLSELLAGDVTAEVEAEAIADEVIQPYAADYLRTVLKESFREALRSGNVGQFVHLARQVEKGDAAFQSRAARDAELLVQESIEALEQQASSLAEGASEAGLQSLRGLQGLREHYPPQLFNALPSHFIPYQERLARAFGKMVHALAEQDTTLALAIARFARQFHCSDEYAAKLDKTIPFLQQKVKKSRETGGISKRWLSILGVGVLLASLLAVGFGLRTAYRSVVGMFYESPLEEGYGADDEEAESLAELRKALEEDGSISRERLEEILREQGGGTQVIEDFTQLYWPERGRAAAAEQELSGEVALGSAPMLVCFPTVAPGGISPQEFTVVGDNAFDALIFFFNGRDYFAQAYIPAKATYKASGKLDRKQVVSTLIVFGKDWSPDAESPCGTPGYFTSNIHYAGFASYTTDPPSLDLKTGDLLVLKKKRLMPARALEEEAFFDLLEKYR